MPLSLAPLGAEQIVRRVSGSGEARSHLEDLGFVPGAPVGTTVQVARLHGEGAVKRRIMDMGITKGTSLYVRKVAPLGDPVEITVRGYELSIRKADAEMIETA